MKVAVVIGSGVPNPTTGGGALTAYTIARQLLDAGDDVVVVTAHDPDYIDPAGESLSTRIAHLRDLGADVVALPSSSPQAMLEFPTGAAARVRRSLRPRDVELFPFLADADAVQDAVASTGADAAFVYHVEALAATRTVTVPRVAGIGDPPHLVRYYRWRDAWPGRQAIRDLPRLQALLRRQAGVLGQLLRECAHAGAFAAHHAAWLRTHGVPGCEYLRTPVPDAGGADWRSRRDKARDDNVVRILLMGHLRGIVTVDGLRVFNRMLPLLDRALDRPYVIDIVGGDNLPSGLERITAHPAVRIHGHADESSISSWLSRADVLLVPTSIPLGIRVRILTGFSAGIAVVAHTANACGIPELVHGRNALLGSTPKELVASIAQVIREPVLRKTIEDGARRTWEETFSPETAGGRIVTLLHEAVASAA